MISNDADVAVVGAGIVGLAHALSAARRGAKVVVFERDERAVGASIRNFGLVWPIGQQAALRHRAVQAREIWREIGARSDVWCADVGSLHVAYHRDEQAVLEEFLATTPEAVEAGCRMLTPDEVSRRSPVVRTDGLRGALWSPTELNVDPREAIPAVAEVLRRDYEVEFHFNTAVHGVSMPDVDTTAGRWRVGHVYVCSGNEFQTLYPDVFDSTGIHRCKLQMLRTVRQPSGWRLGPTLCAGLTLLHYGAFTHCRSLDALRSRLREELPFELDHGIHVLVSQTARGEITIGDSHDYALTHDPFENENVNRAILDYFGRFAALPRPQIAQRWHGVYPKLPDGRPDLVVHPEPGVTVVNGLGGAGMTLSFGLAEDNLEASEAPSLSPT